MKSGSFRYMAVVLAALLIPLAILGVTTGGSPVSPRLPAIGEASYTYDGRVRALGNLSGACASLNAGGALAVLLRINFSETELDQGLFQTADGESGAFVEFQRSEQHTLRLGVNTREGFIRVFIAPQTWRGERHLMVVIRGSGRISVVGDGVRLEEQLPPVDIDCSSWKLGEANDLRQFVGSIEMVWASTSNDEGFDSEVAAYQRDLKSAESRNPSSGFFMMVLAAILLLVAMFGGPSRSRRGG